MQQQTNKITFEHHGTVTLIDIKGDITSFSEPYLNKAYQRVNNQGAEKILLKVGKNAYINSGGIAVLIQLLALTKQNNQLIGIFGVSDHYKKILRMVGITKFAKVHDNLEAALEKMA
jgi:anti-anti-sigma factor